MKRLVFTVNSAKNSSVVSLIKEIDKISCRIFLDLENGFVSVENVNDSMIEDVIELVDNYYTISNVDIDNTFEEITEKSATATQTIAKEPQKVETNNVVAEKHPKVLEPQSEDDLIIKKVEFENQYVENHINSFLKTAYWALYNRYATEKDIGDYILTCMSEISMRFSSKPVIDFAVGDIVDVNYGTHLPGEIIGGHVHAIVCHINGELVYVVPIIKAIIDKLGSSYLLMKVPQDATYNNTFYKAGTVLVDKGRYIRSARFQSVLGKVNPKFFQKLLYQLASTFDFTNCLTEAVEENGTNIEVVKTSSGKAVKSKTTSKKVGSEQSALLEIIGSALDELDSSKKVEKLVEPFLNEIGMTTYEKLVTQAFIVACDITKVNYKNVILELRKAFPELEDETIKNALQKAFKDWLKHYPNLAEKCPKISLMSMLKLFAKKLA